MDFICVSTKWVQAVVKRCQRVQIGETYLSFLHVPAVICLFVLSLSIYFHLHPEKRRMRYCCDLKWSINLSYWMLSTVHYTLTNRHCHLGLNKLAPGAFLTPPEGSESIRQSTWRPRSPTTWGGFTLLTTCSGPITLWQQIRQGRAGCSY